MKKLLIPTLFLIFFPLSLAGEKPPIFTDGSSWFSSLQSATSTIISLLAPSIISYTKQSPRNSRDMVIHHKICREFNITLQSIDDLLYAELTNSEMYSFLGTSFDLLPQELQMKVFSSPHIMANPQLSRRFSYNVHFPAIFFDHWTNPRFVVTHLPSQGNSDYPLVHVSLTDYGKKITAEAAYNTFMCPTFHSPFVRQKLGWLSKEQFLPVETKEFFTIPELSRDTAADRAEIIRLLLVHDDRKVVAWVTTEGAMKARLELLQMGCLYKHKEFRDLIHSFPEYETFVCALAQRLNEYDPTLALHKIKLDNGITLDMYIREQAEGKIGLKISRLRKKFQNTFLSMCKDLDNSIDKALEKLKDPSPNREIKETVNQLEALKNTLSAFDKDSTILSSQYDDAYASIYNTLTNTYGYANTSDITKYINEGRKLFNIDHHFNKQHPLPMLQGLDAIENVIGDYQTHLNTLTQSVNTIVTENLHCTSLAKEYEMNPVLLLQKYCSPIQQHISTDVKKTLTRLLPDLAKNEKVIAGRIAEASLIHNTEGQIQKARWFHGLLSENFQEFCSGIFDTVYADLSSIDVKTVASCVVNTLAARTVDIGVKTLGATPYGTYVAARCAVATYQNASLLFDDICTLTQAISQGDMHSAGAALVETATDFYHAYQSVRGLKDAATGMVFTMQNSDRNKPTGSSGIRYKLPTAANSKEFFKLPFGQKIKNKCRQIRGSSAFVMIEKHNAFLQKGDIFYIDKAHKDHIEIFIKNNKTRCVLNLDGSYNKKKSDAARSRKIER